MVMARAVAGVPPFVHKSFPWQKPCRRHRDAAIPAPVVPPRLWHIHQPAPSGSIASVECSFHTHLSPDPLLQTPGRIKGDLGNLERLL
jgi:hypothetical protein